MGKVFPFDRLHFQICDWCFFMTDCTLKYAIVLSNERSRVDFEYLAETYTEN
jgi:hypothetical protein